MPELRCRHKASRTFMFCGVLIGLESWRAIRANNNTRLLSPILPTHAKMYSPLRGLLQKKKKKSRVRERNHSPPLINFDHLGFFDFRSMHSAPAHQCQLKKISVTSSLTPLRSLILMDFAMMGSNCGGLRNARPCCITYFTLRRCVYLLSLP